MFFTIVLCGVCTLLSLVAISVVTYTHRLFKANRSRRLDLRPFFWAIGFLPMAIVTISNIKFGSPTLLNFLSYLRNPFLGIDMTIGAFAQIGEISFLMDCLTAILVTSTMLVTLSCCAVMEGKESIEISQRQGANDKHVADKFEKRVARRPYLCFGCFLS